MGKIQQEVINTGELKLEKRQNRPRQCLERSYLKIFKDGNPEIQET